MRISEESKRHSRFISRVHRFLFSLKPSLVRYAELISSGHVYRPHYAYAMFSAAVLARELGYRSISAIEFGVHDGSGLIDMEYHAMDIQKYLGVYFEIYGFPGLEEIDRPIDYSDVPYLWRSGQHAADRGKLAQMLLRAKLVSGPLKEATDSFFDVYKPAPIGVVFEDFYQYRETLDTFNIFSRDGCWYLPRVFMYFDNTLGTSEHAGSLLAIRKYNELNEQKKIDLLSLKAEELSIRWKKWNYLGKKFYLWHSFMHERYADFVVNS
jgi:hypothetical protein